MLGMINRSQILLLLGVVLMNIGVGMIWLAVRRIHHIRNAQEGVRNRGKPILANEFIKIGSGVILIGFGIYVVYTMLEF